MRSKPTRFERMLQRHGLSKPGATEAFPWCHRALKVRNKSFAFIVAEDDGTVTMSVKLPKSGYQALAPKRLLKQPAKQPRGSKSARTPN